jgi:nickel-dependent lactate racemase
MNYHDIRILYGTEEIKDFIPPNSGEVIELSSPKIKSEITNLEADLRRVLEHPENSPPLKALVNRHYRDSGKKIILLTDDNTRPNTHTKILHPLVLEYLINECDVRKDDLRILVASGTHRPPTPEEIQETILGDDLFNAYRDQILIHNDQENLAELGKSSQGTPITINQDALNSCLLIPITDSEYHYFAGIAGTVKQLFPGIAGRKTTNTNHPRMFDKQKGFKETCRLGNTAGNPVISDMKEMADCIQQRVPVFCIDAILDQGEITYLNAGDILSLHETAGEKLAIRRNLEVERPADLVLVSVGKLGINLYQAGKGIHAAWNAAKKPGGAVLLLAPCQDGAGAPGYIETMDAIQGMNLDQALEWVIDNKCSVETFRIGNQKPVDSLRILKTLGEGQIKILSEMDPDELRNTYRLDPIPHTGTPQESLRAYFSQFFDENPEALVYVMSDAGLHVTPQEQ